MFYKRRNDLNGPVVVRRGEKPQIIERHHEIEEHHSIRNEKIDFYDSTRKTRRHENTRRHLMNKRKPTKETSTKIRSWFIILAALYFFWTPIKLYLIDLSKGLDIEPAQNIALTWLQEDAQKTNKTTARSHKPAHAQPSPLKGIQSLIDLSYQLYTNKNYATAEKNLNQIIDIAKRELGPDLKFNPADRDQREIAHLTGLAYTHKGRLFVATEDLKAAQLNYALSFSVWKDVNGVHNRETITALEQLAKVQFQDTAYSDARETYRNIAAIYESWAPSPHEVTSIRHHHAIAIMMIGVTFSYEGDHNEAYSYLLEAKNMGDRYNIHTPGIQEHIKHTKKQLR